MGSKSGSEKNTQKVQVLLCVGMERKKASERAPLPLIRRCLREREAFWTAGQREERADSLIIQIDGQNDEFGE